MTFGIPSEGKMLKYLRYKIDSIKLTAKDSHTTLNASPVCVGFSSGWFFPSKPCVTSHLRARSLPLLTNHTSTVVLRKRHLSLGSNTAHFLFWVNVAGFSCSHFLTQLGSDAVFNCDEMRVQVSTQDVCIYWCPARCDSKSLLHVVISLLQLARYSTEGLLQLGPLGSTTFLPDTKCLVDDGRGRTPRLKKCEAVSRISQRLWDFTQVIRNVSNWIPAPGCCKSNVHA